MNSRKLIGMAVALMVLAGIAFIQKKSDQRHHPEPEATEATLFHGLDLNTVDALSVSLGSNSVELVKKDGHWLNASLYDYPVNFKMLADALRAAGEVKMGRPVRAANVKDTEFGLDKARTLILKAGGKDAVKLEVGAQREASETAAWANQHFIRKNAGDEIYLVDYDFRPFSTEPSDWIEKKLLNVRPDEIVSVKVGDIELNSVSNEWTLAGLDPETEELQISQANKLRGALQNLNCSTVVDASGTDAELGFTNSIIYTAFTTNQTFTVELGAETESGRYVRFKGDVPENLKPWTFEISTYDAGDFEIGRDLLVKKEKPADSKETSHPE